MKLYFLNSYQQSPTGFQLSRLDTHALQLSPCRLADIPCAEIRDTLGSSGATCLLGQTDTAEYLICRGLRFTDKSGREWYVNMAIEADAASRGRFSALAANLLTRHEAFLRVLPEWFYTRKEGALSYGVHGEALQSWLANAQAAESTAPDNYWGRGETLENFRTMLDRLQRGDYGRLLLLVPEGSVGYFRKQNRSFAEEKPAFVFTAERFQMLLEKDPALFKLPETEQRQVPPPPSAAESSQKHPKNIRMDSNRLMAACLLTTAVGTIILLLNETKKKRSTKS